MKLAIQGLLVFLLSAILMGIGAAIGFWLQLIPLMVIVVLLVLVSSAL